MTGHAVVDIDARCDGVFPPLRLVFLPGLFPILNRPAFGSPAVGEGGATFCSPAATGVPAESAGGGWGGSGCSCCVEAGKVKCGDGGVPSEDDGESTSLAFCAIAAPTEHWRCLGCGVLLPLSISMLLVDAAGDGVRKSLASRLSLLTCAFSKAIWVALFFGLLFLLPAPL